MNERNISAEIIADSINPHGNRLTTFLLRYPRFIHAEVMTHRMLSRNAASSRAIPARKLLDQILEFPATPELWTSDKAGMQGGEPLTGEPLISVRRIWQDAKARAISAVEALMGQGLHKSLANRVVEPWFRYANLVSATEWHNFFALRAHPDAQPEFQVLAYRMLDAYLKSVPSQVQWGQWHIPFRDNMPEELSRSQMCRIAVARCARLSYMTQDGVIDADKDLQLYARLMERTPKHASPAEHVACARPALRLQLRPAAACDISKREPGNVNALSCFEQLSTEPDDSGRYEELVLPYDHRGIHQGNFRGWTQWRKMWPGENIEQTDLQDILADKPDWIEL